MEQIKREATSEKNVFSIAMPIFTAYKYV